MWMRCAPTSRRKVPPNRRLRVVALQPPAVPRVSQCMVSLPTLTRMRLPLLWRQRPVVLQAPACIRIHRLHSRQHLPYHIHLLTILLLILLRLPSHSTRLIGGIHRRLGMRSSAVAPKGVSWMDLRSLSGLACRRLLHFRHPSHWTCLV